MFENNRISIYRDALSAAEDLSTISSINIANSRTLGYKAIVGKFVDKSCCECFYDVLSTTFEEKHGVKLELNQKNTSGFKTKINGQSYEESNVDTATEMNNILHSANMTRAALSGLQVENRMQSEIINLGRQ